MERLFLRSRVIHYVVAKWVCWGIARPGPVAPNINDFYTGGDQWTQSMQSPRRSRSCMRMSLQQMGTPLISAACPRLARLTIPIWRRTMQLSCLWNGSIQSWIANTRVCGRRWPTKESRKGSNAYSRELSRFGEQRNDAANQAALAGIGLGMQQQGLTFNQMNQLRNQAMQEQSYVRGLPLSEFNALLGGSSSMQFRGMRSKLPPELLISLGRLGIRTRATLGHITQDKCNAKE